MNNACPKGQDVLQAYFTVVLTNKYFAQISSGANKLYMFCTNSAVVLTNFAVVLTSIVLHIFHWVLTLATKLTYPGLVNRYISSPKNLNLWEKFEKSTNDP